MRLGRLVAGGIVVGALAGFVAGLLRPRPRGVLPGLAEQADPLAGPGPEGGSTVEDDPLHRGVEDLAVAARASRPSGEGAG
jgi:hypothetical protein